MIGAKTRKRKIFVLSAKKYVKSRKLPKKSGKTQFAACFVSVLCKVGDKIDN